MPTQTTTLGPRGVEVWNAEVMRSMRCYMLVLKQNQRFLHFVAFLYRDIFCFLPGGVFMILLIKLMTTNCAVLLSRYLSIDDRVDQHVSPAPVLATGCIPRAAPFQCLAKGARGHAGLSAGWVLLLHVGEQSTSCAISTWCH